MLARAAGGRRSNRDVEPSRLLMLRAAVIDKYGIDEYVREARDLKRKYEQALRNLKE